MKGLRASPPWRRWSRRKREERGVARQAECERGEGAAECKKDGWNAECSGMRCGWGVCSFCKCRRTICWSTTVQFFVSFCRCSMR